METLNNKLVMKTIIRFLFVFILVSITMRGFSQERIGGLALYTVRNEMRTDPIATLKTVADAGYQYVEAANYNNGTFYGMKPEEFKKTLKELGLTPMSAHMGMVNLENADQLIMDTKNAGIKYFVIPVPPMGHFRYNRETGMSMSEDVDTVLNILNTIGKKCANAGIMLLYHNHDFEFKENVNGIIPIDYFLENTDPEHVNFQMDLYWVTKAGLDPLAYFEKYPGRFKSWHVKDMDTEGRFAPVGQGTIDFKRILEKKELSGMEYYLVEQDATFDKKPLDVISISMEGLKKYGFQ